MKSWQKILIITVLVGCILHTIRDIQQFLGISSILSNTFVKAQQISSQSILWSPWNTVCIESILCILSVLALRRNRFGEMGWLIIAIVLITFIGFIYYYVVL